MVTNRDVQRLLDWYEKNQRSFPWRENPHPYWVWLAEIMSQQTQMVTLIPYFRRFIERFPNVEALAKSEEQEVLSAWTGLGYYSRARNVRKAAQKIVESGGFPKTFEAWLELPGVGPYTAAAISSQSFGISEPVWDGNVQRVFSRLLAWADAHSPRFRGEVLPDLRELMTGFDPASFNQAWMELGALICTPKNPACAACPVQASCKAHVSNKVGEFPPPKPRREVKKISSRVWICTRRDQAGELEVLLRRRPKEYWFGGMWDFESELGFASQPMITMKKPPEGTKKSLGAVRHRITHHEITLESWVVETSAEARTAAMADKNTDDLRWVSLETISSGDPGLPVSTTARKVLRLLFRAER